MKKNFYYIRIAINQDHRILLDPTWTKTGSLTESLNKSVRAFYVPYYLTSSSNICSNRSSWKFIE